MTERDLERHRRDIETLDRRILHLVRERLDLARQIGELKRRSGIPLRNFEVEAEVHRRFDDDCGELQLDPSLGHDLAMFLIRKSVEEQASLIDSSYEGDRLRCLVVGGKGGMGRWMMRFLHSQGHVVSVFDPAAGPSAAHEVDDLATGAMEAELIVLAVPMSVCGELLEELDRIGTRAVVAEMCSLKTHLLPVIDRVRARGLRVVSFHPLFGPGTQMLSERAIAFCTDASPADLALLRGLFEPTSAALVEMTPQEHDRRMGLVLGLTHLCNLAFARALGHSGVGAARLAEVAGVTFRKQLSTTREVCRENPLLYHQIQAYNAITPETAEWLVRSVEEFADAARQEGAGAFAALMRECREYLEAE